MLHRGTMGECEHATVFCFVFWYITGILKVYITASCFKLPSEAGPRPTLAFMTGSPTQLIHWNIFLKHLELNQARKPENSNITVAELVEESSSGLLALAT